MRVPSPVAAAALFLLLAASACRKGDPAPPQVTVVSLGPENIARVEHRELRSGPLISGRLEPRHQATIRAEIPGQLLDVVVEAGQSVRKGQLLARIDPSSAPVQLEAARAAVQSARRSLELARMEEKRVGDLAKVGAVAHQDLERAQAQSAQATAQLHQAQAQLSQAQKQVARAAVHAPFAGVVSERQVNPGDLVQPGEALLTVVDPSSLRLEASVPAEERASIQLGAPVDFHVAGFEGHIAGYVERINPVLDPSTGQLRILVDIPNPQERMLLGGLYAEGRIASERVHAASVPTSAINTDTNPPSVLHVLGNALQRVPVKLGLRDEEAEWVELLQGPPPGSLVVTGDVRDLPPGTRVMLLPPEREAVGGGGRQGAGD